MRNLIKPARIASILLLLSTIAVPMTASPPLCAHTKAGEEGAWGDFGSCYTGTDGIRKCIHYRYNDNCTAVDITVFTKCTPHTNYHSSYEWVTCSTVNGVETCGSDYHAGPQDMTHYTTDDCT